MVELHHEGFAPAAYSAGLFFLKLISARGVGEQRWMINFLNVNINIISFAKVNKCEG